MRTHPAEAPRGRDRYKPIVLSALLKHSAERMACAEPYYAVLTHERFLLANIHASLPAFFATGEEDVRGILDRAARSGRAQPLRTVLDFGCGPGRLIPALIKRGFRVTAVESSPSWRALARSNTRSYDSESVAVIDFETFVESPASFDLIIVNRFLQHLDPPVGLACLRLVAERLVDDGLLYCNAPLVSDRAWTSRASLIVRERIPFINAAANYLRGRDARVPLSVPRLYSADQVLLTLRNAGCLAGDISVQFEGDLLVAHLLARKRSREPALELHVKTTDIDTLPEPLKPTQPGYIAPEELIRTTPVEQFNKLAEDYFTSSDDWTEQLTKPFGSIDDAPAMLVSLGVLLQGCELVRGMTVLDFGGGTGWLSRALAQLGCIVYLCDVSESALKIAETFRNEQPLIGSRAGAVRSLRFDGFRLDLDDGSIDRVVCFDSFHHVPNIQQVLSEFGRVLKPGALAAFSEPGPEHSRSPQSQFEMRAFGVLENDVDVSRIWQIAQEHGFVEMKLVPFNGAPTYISLGEFDELLRGGAALQHAARLMRDFTANVRTFTLRKEGEEVLDSRRASGLACDIQVELARHLRVGDTTPFVANIRNTGTALWLPSSVDPGGVSLGAHLYRGDQLKKFDFMWTDVSESGVAPGAEVVVHGKLAPLETGRYRVEFDCVAKSVRWFSQVGSTTVSVDIEVT